MKTTLKTKLLTVMLALCMVVSMVPVSVFAAPGTQAAATADFTTDEVTALALLNAAKTGSEDSTWDSTTKTLTLKGIEFTTTATTALKLPAGTTIVLADGTDNQITGGGTTVATSGGYSKDIYVCGIDAQGALIIKGESSGTGTLSVSSGTHENTGNAWTYSTAILAKGDFSVESGSVTAVGGTAYSADCAFSHGVEMVEGNSLFVKGGTLTAIGGESFDTGDTEIQKTFSRGVDVYKGNVSVSGSAKLVAQCVPSMDGEGLAYGVNILLGKLMVLDNAQLLATATRAIEVSGGCLQQTGGQITAKSTGDNIGHSLSVTRENNSSASNTGNVEITGGTLDASSGGVYMYQNNRSDQYGVFSVSSGTVKAGSVYGANSFRITGGTVEAQCINSKRLTIDGGTLTVCEPVHKSQYSGRMYTDSAIWCSSDITMNAGRLEVSWDWGAYTPCVFTADEYSQYPTPLVNSSGTVAINGGTAIFNTGCAGNTVLRGDTITHSANVIETGADDTQIQKYGDTPVVFSDMARMPVTVSGIAVQTKEYDATTIAQIDASAATVSGVAGGDSVGLDVSGVTAAFDNKNVGQNKAVSVTGTFQLRGRDAYKYSLTQPSPNSLTGVITPCKTVTNATVAIQKVSKDTGTFDEPYIIGVFGPSGSQVTETSTGTVTYTIEEAGLTNVTYDDIVAYLKTLPLDKTVELTYTFIGRDNYAGAKFDDGNGGTTNIGKIKVQIVRGNYKLTFDACDGSGTTTAMTTDEDGKISSLPKDPSRSGYKFNGWYTEVTGGTRVTVDTVFKNNTTIYAQWLPDYKIIEGANGTWTKNTDGTLTFRANGDLTKFTQVKVDGTVISSDKYTAASGSTIVTLKADYLSTLTVGKHTLTVVYSDGECSTDFEVQAAKNDNSSSESNKAPKTGDNSYPLVWIILLFASGSAVVGTTIYNRKRKNL